MAKQQRKPVSELVAGETAWLTPDTAIVVASVTVNEHGAAIIRDEHQHQYVGAADTEVDYLPAADA